MGNRIFSSVFNTVSDFTPFYITPDGSFGCNHSISTDNPFENIYSHKASIISKNADNNDPSVPHRGYPTIELYKTDGGSYLGTCLISLRIWLSIDLGVHGTPDWFSPLTLSDTENNTWGPVVTLAIGPERRLALQHVPYFNQASHIYQSEKTFPMNTWVKIDTEISFDPVNGYAKCWQDDVLVSHAQVLGRSGKLTQIHAGMYASSSVPSGVVYNGTLEVFENNSSKSVYSPGRLGVIKSFG